MPSTPSLATTVKPQNGFFGWVRVALDIPIFADFDYRSTQALPEGTRVIVPFGRRKRVGMVVAWPEKPSVAPEQIKDVDEVLDDTPPMPADWMRLARFAASYYRRPLGEVMLPALPAGLKQVSAYQGKRSAGGPVKRMDRRPGTIRKTPASETKPEKPVLNAGQQQALDTLLAVAGHQTLLLHGVTGSGKTEVYIRAIEAVLKRGRQVLLLVPEINLTPQLERALRTRLPDDKDHDPLAILHSGLAAGGRLRAWMRAQRGQAKVLLGTRLAIFTPLPRLGLIIVDEEHDTSYKQQDGLRYSARDLAVWRGRDLDIPVLLGSATPSLETWHHAQTGHYRHLSLVERATEATLPDIHLVDTRRLRTEQGFSPQALDAMATMLEAGRQVLVFINRRGYAPVLNCGSCGWVTQCRRCTAYMVLHRGRQTSHYLQCHHCGLRSVVPSRCPDCGDVDLKPMGRGTQRIEEFLGHHFPDARLARIDADSTRRKGSADRLFKQVHAGETDILVGTQMVAKGHDFINLGLVVVLNADAMLFAQDFRAPERLFAQLMQVAGRAGRHGLPGQVMIQTDYPEQPLYQALCQHDYEGFANHALAERQSVGLPPFARQALLMAEARELTQALDFLNKAANLPAQHPEHYASAAMVTLYDPVPLRVVRVANVERAQLLLECEHRPALQAFLATWAVQLVELARQCRVRHTLEIDPLEI